MVYQEQRGIVEDMMKSIGRDKGKGRSANLAKTFFVFAFIFIFIFTFTFTFTFTSLCFASTAEQSERFQSSGPLNIRNQMPLYLFYMAPSPDKAATLKKGKIEIDASYHVSNTIIDQHPIWPCQRFVRTGLEGREWWAYIDTEVNRVDLNFSYGLLDNLEASVDIPYYIFSGGYLDGFIENFEKTFSFIKTPNAREEAERYQYDYRVYNRGSTIIESTSAPRNLGEISTYLKYKCFNETKWLPTISLRGAIKFPTSNDNLIGSKKFDYGLGFLLDKKIFDRFFMYFNFNWTLLGKPDVLVDLDVFNKQMYHGMVGFEYFLTNKTSLLLQATANTTVYDKGVPCTSNDPVVLTAGFNHNFNDKISWQIAMDENTNSAAPDFGLFTSLKIKI